MKLEKHRYDDVVILKFTGEFDTFNLPGFSARIDTMIDRGDNKLVLDLFLSDAMVYAPHHELHCVFS